ncbi:MAG: hypothetical protein ABIK96_03735 [bacterium]
MKRLLTIALLITLAAGGAIAGECGISGVITGQRIDDPLLPAWQYTLVLDWDTGTPYALSHANLLMDIPGGTCTCDNFVEALTWANPMGSGPGEDGCTVNYNAFLECDGDPSIPEVDGILLKFEPVEGEGCEPANVGTMTLVFYSHLPPAPVDEDLLSLVDKFGQNHCFGYLAGDFPSMPCDPVDAAGTSFGTVKGFFR